jgi:hypothetical protein
MKSQRQSLEIAYPESWSNQALEPTPKAFASGLLNYQG